MRHLTPLLLVPLIGIAFAFTGCDQQQPLAQKPQPIPGAKEGETPPVEPDARPQRHSDGTVAIPSATAPTTPDDQNSRGAPITPLPPPSTAPPTQSPTPVPVPTDGASVNNPSVNASGGMTGP